MKRTSKLEFDLNSSPFGCAPCLKEALKIDRQINKSYINEMKISQIKKIVQSIFENTKKE